ncbi:MAG: hypothetical protein K2M42_03160 [Oscillospiraceae bacterium]|nr:hypothetical protein [Oscillospiraceae bacterium]
MTHYQPHGRTAANAHATAGQFQTANAVGQNTVQQRSKVPLENFDISLGAGGRTFKSCHPDNFSSEIRYFSGFHLIFMAFSLFLFLVF